MNYYSCGKLLITAEYLILKGAKGLAIPTKQGQKMSVKRIQKNKFPGKPTHVVIKNGLTVGLI